MQYNAANGFAYAVSGVKGKIIAVDLNNSLDGDITSVAISPDGSKLAAAIQGDVSPEGLCFITAADSKIGENILLAACEVSGTLAAYRCEYSAMSPTDPTDPTEPTNPSTVTYGDVNGDGKINLLDLIAMRKCLAKWTINIDVQAADCNGDGKINLFDLILMRKYLAKWNVDLGPQE